MSLYSSFLKIKNSYYGIPIDADELFEKAENCRLFINEHFKEGGKQQALNLPFSDEYICDGKHFHTVSLYLLGLHLQKLFQQKIASNLKRKIPALGKWYDDCYEYKYSWFLSCLYHDTASCVEAISDPNNTSCCNNCIDRYRFPPAKYRRFKRKTVKNYCRYRKDNKAQDHGIFGGCMLYDRLCRNFKRKTSGHNWEENPVCMKDGLAWRREHLDHFAYVADAIICHNMWTAQGDDEKAVKRYKSYGLDELIIYSDEDKLSIDQYPLQFMLCLLDTIEPVKRFSSLPARTVLENISIDPLENNGIRISWKECIKREANFWTWMKGISTLGDWMYVDVSNCHQTEEWCYVEISFR